MPKKQSNPKARKAPRRGAAKRAKPGALGANLAFGLLTVFILAAGGTSAAWASSCIVNPAGQKDSFSALPVYNVIGQRTDRLEFWPRARYHDLARSNGYPLPYSPQQALDETGFQEILLNLMGSCTYIHSLTGLDERGDQMACYSYYTDSVICRFYDDVPVQVQYENNFNPRIYQGVLNASSGRGSSNDQLCYTALITRDASTTPATEEQYQKAYQTILEHLMMLAGDRGDPSFYYRCGPLDTAIATLIALFPDAAESINAADEPFPGETTSETTSSSALNTLQLFEQWFVQSNLENDISPWDMLGVPEPDRSNPEETERFLQEYFQAVHLLDLQILRQDDCYLILFQNGSNVLGLYYDPLLQTYTGFGIQ